MAYIGKARPKGSVSARVLDKDGNVIADLGMIAGGKVSKEEKKRQNELLAKLKRDRIKAEKEARNGG